MVHRVDDSKNEPLRVFFGRCLKLEFHRWRVTSDGGLLAYREYNDALGLTEAGGGLTQRLVSPSQIVHRCDERSGAIAGATNTGLRDRA